jgi:hypothetical protein
MSKVGLGEPLKSGESTLTESKKALVFVQVMKTEGEES